MDEYPPLLTVLCIGAALLGLAGVAGAAFGVVNQLQPDAVETAMLQVLAPELSPEQAERHRQAAAEIRSITDSWSGILWALRLIQLGLSPLLFVGAVQTWRIRPGGRRLLRGACAAVAVLELVQAVPAARIHQQVVPIVDRQIADIAEHQEETLLPGMGTSLQDDVRKMRFLGWLFSTGWLATQVGFCGFAFIYLGRPELVEFFRRAEADRQHG
jgi:hypothetical protein